jgi:hypothetical protein
VNSALPGRFTNYRIVAGRLDHVASLLTVGRAWQSGLIAGLIEREIDLGDASLIIGTSAGAIVGAQLALGLNFAAPSKLDLAVQAAPASSSSDMSELAAIARAVRSPEPEIERAKIGAFAIEAQTASEEEAPKLPLLRHLLHICVLHSCQGDLPLYKRIAVHRSLHSGAAAQRIMNAERRRGSGGHLQACLPTWL